MELNILSGELERLYDLDELKQLSERLLGLHPGQVGGVGAKASFARALTERCAEQDAVEALLDAVVAEHADVDPRLVELRQRGFERREELDLGDTLGSYLITHKLGEGRLGITYRARQGDNDVRLRVLWKETARDRRGVQRYFTHSRLVAGRHHGLPQTIYAGPLDDSGQALGLVHEYVDGQTLSERLKNNGKFRLGEIKPILVSLLETLDALHSARLAHGSLCLDNVLVSSGGLGGDRVMLLDAGTNHVRVRASLNGFDHRLATVGSPASVAPEVIRGRPADARSDVYSFGAILYELLAGAPLYGARSPLDSLVGHLSRAPERLSAITGEGWVPAEVEEWLLSLLDKDPSRRPANARDLLRSLNALGRSTNAGVSLISDEELVQRLQTLTTNPWDESEAAALEAAVNDGADPVNLAEGFEWVAEQLHPDEGSNVRAARRGMLLRAARLYENAADQPASAERVYALILELDPEDAEANAGLERTRKRLGKHEAIVEELLVRTESIPPGPDRASLFAKIGKLCELELEDRDQALVAYTQALAESPEEDTYAERIEKLAASRSEAWEEVLGNLFEAAEAAEGEAKSRLLNRMGRWYSDKLARPDLAVQCFTAVLGQDANDEQALSGLAAVYKKSQQWADLGALLMRRAEVARPSMARDLKTEAAELAEDQLGNPASARDLYEAVLAEDPGHARAGDGLARIYERLGDHSRLAKLLDQRAEGSSGEQRHRVLCRAAELYDDQLRDSEAAIERYQTVLREAPHNAEALRGLERVYSKLQRYDELYRVLETQLGLAVTPRQKIQLYERLAALCEEEFLDFARAAEACARILDIDPENDAALTAIARHYRSLGRWQDVADVYEAHLQVLTDPERKVEKLLALGRVLVDNLARNERAMVVYEQVLELRPSNVAALEALAKLRAHGGDVDRAMDALDALADKAPTAEARAEQYLKAARFLESVGRHDAAIERYKAAVDANPADRALAKQLREAYVARGDVSAAVELLERELARTEVTLARAKLSGEIARLCHDHVRDDARAESYARRALELDPTNLDALTVLGNIAYKDEQYRQAVFYLDQVVNHLDPTQSKDAVRIFACYVDALSKSGNKEKALWACDALGNVANGEPAVLSRIAEVTFEFGSSRRAFELYRALVNDFAAELSVEELALAHYRLGESARREGDLALAQTQLERAIEIDPSLGKAYESLVKVHESKENWHEAIRVLHHQLDLANPEERAELMLHIGEIAAARLRDPDYAARTYLAALSERPDDRKALAKLMQLYSQERDWKQLVSVVLRLADLCEDDKQKAKYLHTAGMITHREMNDVQHAVDLFDRSLSHDPELEHAATEALKLRRKLRDFEGVKELLKLRIKHASAKDDQQLLLSCLNELAEVYYKHLAKVDQAIAVMESAQEIEPDNQGRNDALVRLYVSHPTDYLDKAVRALAKQVADAPYEAEPYQRLRQVYTEVRRADGAWLACQALAVLGKASPDELRFYQRMRSEVAAPAQAVLSERDWIDSIVPAGTEPLLSSIFALIQSSVISARARALEDFGYGPGHEIDPLQYPYGAIYALHYASQVLGIEQPPLYQDPNDGGGLTFLNTPRPSIVLGRVALQEDLPPQAAAFIAARHITYYQPGFYVRQLLPNVTMLKAWLFAAIRLLKPQFPITGDVEVPAREAYGILEKTLPGQLRDHLAHTVSKLTSQGTALDLKKWMACVDLTADRVGLLLCHDLETAVELIRASGDNASSVPLDDRLRDVIGYSVSAEYLAIRQKLGIAVDS